MVKKTITYVDYNGQKRTEDHFFHFSQAELAELEFSVDGGLTGLITKIINSVDQTKLIALFKEMIMKSYGIKSDDGKRFIKSKEISESFSQTPAYSMLFMELATNDEEGAKFVNALLPEVIKDKTEVENEVQKIKNSIEDKEVGISD